jgi:hypothetical protein
VSAENGPNVAWRQAFAQLGERAAPGPDCPEPDRLWAAATAESPVAERQEIIAHTATCASCAGAFRLALGLAREEPGRAAAGAPLSPPSAWPRITRRVAPLAALAAVLLLALLLPGWWRSRPSPPYRGGETLEIRSRLREGVTLPREQAGLRWSAGPPGSRYEIRVLTREAREIAVEIGLTAPEYRIPPPALADLAAGTVLYWQVKTLRPDGTSALSKTFSVRLR